MIERTITCPLGSKCETVVDGKLEVCAWYTTLEGCNPQTGERMAPKSMCAMAWIPILMVDANGKTNQVFASVTDLRNSVDMTPGRLVSTLVRLRDGS
jgi:hypothetical protein